MSEGDIFSVMMTTLRLFFLLLTSRFLLSSCSSPTGPVCQKGDSLYSDDNDGIRWMGGIKTEGDVLPGGRRDDLLSVVFFFCYQDSVHVLFEYHGGWPFTMAIRHAAEVLASD